MRTDFNLPHPAPRLADNCVYSKPMAVERQAFASDQEIWRNPPWRGGVVKHRLGLTPIPFERWLAEDAALYEHKQECLEQAYDQVVAQQHGWQPPANSSEWVLPWRTSEGYPHWVANIGAHIAEDLCLVDVQDNLRFVTGLVAAPSYWSLHEKLGKPLWQVHAPVQGMNAKIGDNITRFMRNAPVGQPFYRSNWFVHERAAFRPPPDVDLLALDCNDWVIRSEQQVLYRPDSRYLVFTIRVLFAALGDLHLYPEAGQDMLETLERLDTLEIAHAGGVEKHQRLHEYVRAVVEI